MKCEIFGKIEGCLVTSGIADLGRQSPTLKIPLSSMESSIQTLLFFYTLDEVLSSVALGMTVSEHRLTDLHRLNFLPVKYLSL